MSRGALAAAEKPVEEAVTSYLGAMRLLWIEVSDEADRNSLRGCLERNAISLLSNFDRKAIDPPSPDWLGFSSDRPLVSQAGLWNQRHVTETRDPAFLELLAAAVESTRAVS